MTKPKPLVTIITSTFERHDLLFSRCIPSVDAQDYPNLEHIIVSDGIDNELAEKLFPPYRKGKRSRWFTSVPERDPQPHWGHYCRLLGLELAAGSLIGYVDDDDALRPDHVSKLVAALEKNPEAGWAQSVMGSHSPSGITEIGHGEPCCGNIGTPMIMHRKSIIEHGTWGPASQFEDWDLINRWLHAGITYVRIDDVTIDVWPSLYGH